MLPEVLGTSAHGFQAASWGGFQSPPEIRSRRLPGILQVAPLNLKGVRMSSEAATSTTNGASKTAIEAVAPASIEVTVAGATVKAPSKLLPDRVVDGVAKASSIVYRAKMRVALAADNTKSASEVLLSLIGRVLYAGQNMTLGSKYTNESGGFVIGKEADRKDKNGTVTSTGRPQVVFRSVDTLGPNEYQILAKCRIGEANGARYVEVAIDATRLNLVGGSFTEIGSIEGEMDL